MQGIAAAEEPLDPEIRAFVAEMKAGFSQYPPFSHLTFAGARAVAEAVRLPWRQGGPVMASTDERRIGTDAGEVRVRIHRPDRGRTAGIAPALVYLHGGGWTLFSLDTHDRVMREYAQRAGVIVVGVDYALSPEAKFPKALEQTVGTMRVGTRPRRRARHRFHAAGRRRRRGGETWRRCRAQAARRRQGRVAARASS